MMDAAVGSPMRDRHRAPGLRTWLALLALALLPSLATSARASVALLVEQPYGGLGVWNPTGHSAMYFDHLCAATPVRLRPCGPGELGVVVSRYDGIGNLDWVAVPLIPYLYAVGSAQEIPERVDRLTVLRMRDLYRREYLQAVAPDTETGGMPQGNWYELVGSAYDRTIYGFRVSTTAEQDARVMELLNDRPNVTRYDGAFRNCADFARLTLNRIYPHAVRRNFVADFGLTTPKSVARGLTHYARKHPGTDFAEFVVPQVPGDLPRSLGIEGVTESLLKRYGVPMTLVSPPVTAAVLVAYVGQGRFPMPKGAPKLDVAAMQAVAARQAMALQQRPLAADSLVSNAETGIPVTRDPSMIVTMRGSTPPVLADATPADLVSPAECQECVEGDVLP